MIKVLIIEDEIPARKKLRRFLESLDMPIAIAAEIDTVAASISFLKANSVDVIFSDIELLDGNCFDIYEAVAITCPVIFTTAYDRFWMNAFEHNGVDYLLKPFTEERFRKAWDKYLMFRRANVEEHEAGIAALAKLIQLNFSEKQYRKRFVITTNQSIYFLETASILFFEANAGVVAAYDNKGKKHLLTAATLKEIEDELHPLEFFRINRSELINKSYIEKIERYGKGTLAIKLTGYEKHLITSQANTTLFRDWIER